MIKKNRILLNSGWEFKLNKTYKDVEIPTSAKNKIKKFAKTSIPSTILNDLLKKKIIPDPFISDNELKVSWVSECDWLYKKSFNVSDISFNKLVFEGIDTISEIWLNGKLLGKSENMFRRYLFDVSGILKLKGNQLKVILKSPLKHAEEMEDKYGRFPVALNSSRVYIRKAQYSFGWDWGPSLPNLGIWKDVYLERKEKTAIKDFYFETVALRDNNAEVEINFTCNSPSLEKYTYRLKLHHDRKEFIKTGKCKKNNRINFVLSHPKLWWPDGLGKQNLYGLKLELLDENNIQLAVMERKVGIRTVQLLLKENNKKAFKFIINGKQVFIKGANWIPIDSILDRGTENRYEELISKAAGANMNMLRVWGGGIYENDIFYELCDKYGLLVWQDFMFACGAYPQHKEFISNISEEINYNVDRIRNHPCLALWCGNNENEWIWTQEQNSHYSKMPGYKIYHDVIPNILKKKNIVESYWPSSPFGDDTDPNSQTSGNRHQWYIWSFWKDYKTVVDDNSLFVSEFGFQGAANKDTLEKAILIGQRNIQSKIVEFHNKQIEGQERVLRFLAAHLPLRTGWDDFIYLSQLNQGLALKTCLEHWRMNEKTNGSIIWQINDVWPVISWSLVDSDAKPKISYHFVKESFSDIVTTITVNDNEIVVNINNSRIHTFNGYLKVELTELKNGKCKLIKNIPLRVKTDHNIKLKLGKINLDNILVTSSIWNDHDKMLHRNFYVNKEWKHVRLPKAKVKYYHDAKNHIIKLKALTPVLFGDLYYKDFAFTKRGFILLKNESISISYRSNRNKTLDVKKLKLYSLNDYLHSN